MPKKIDLETDDQELDLEDEDQDTEDDEEGEDEDSESDDSDDNEDDDEDDDARPKKRKTSRRTAGDSSELKAQLDQIQQLLAAKTTTEGQKQRKVDVLLKQLSESGKFNADQLGVLALFADAIRGDLGEDYESDKQQMTEKTLFAAANKEFKRAVDRWVRKHPQMKWSRDEIAKQAAQEMFKGRGFDDARAEFEQRQLPDTEQFEKAVARIAKNYLKDHGIKSSNASEQLDVRSSRSKPASSSSTKKGELDPEKLSEKEKEIYFETKNATHDEDLAREALAAFRKFKRGR